MLQSVIEDAKENANTRLWDLASSRIPHILAFLGRLIFYTPPVLGGAALFDNSAAAVYKNPVPYPEGPKIEKNQDFAPGLKFSSDQSQIEIFNRD